MKQMTDDELLKMIDEAFMNFNGDAPVLESAIGAAVLAKYLGWHGVRVIHSRGTFNKYQGILGIKFKDRFPERGPQAKRLAGIRMLDKIGKFWQALSGGLISAKKAARMKASAEKTGDVYA